MRRNQKRGLSFFQVGLIAIVLALAITYFGFTKSVPFRHHYTITAKAKGCRFGEDGDANVRSVWLCRNLIRPEQASRFATHCSSRPRRVSRSSMHAARSWLRALNSSRAARDKPHFRAIISAPTAWLNCSTA